MRLLLHLGSPEIYKFVLLYSGRSGRAGRSGEAVTFYTDADVRYLKNIANAIKNSGSEVPEWILSMPKLKWRKHRPKRESLFAKQRDDEEE